MEWWLGNLLHILDEAKAEGDEMIQKLQHDDEVQQDQEKGLKTRPAKGARNDVALKPHRTYAHKPLTPVTEESEAVFSYPIVLDVSTCERRGGRA